jgi:predicted metal-dependent hydrolase
MFINFLDDAYSNLKPKGKKKPLLKVKKVPAKLIPDEINWEIEHQIIPVDLFRDPKRTGWRYAFGKNNKLLVRIPKLQSAAEADLLQEIQNRLAERMKQKPALYDFFNQKQYYDDDVLTIGTREYTLKLFIEARKSCTGRLIIEKDKKNIHIRADAYLDSKVRHKTIGTIISRIVSADAMQEFSKRVDEFNDKFFKKDIRNIKFKQNHSNWGSCSSTGNLNFSSRLLFAPQIVQDYVIIHELAHLVELNHSDRFWAIVAEIMPNYAEQEKWLKLNAAACRY